MNSMDYIKNVVKTESINFKDIRSKLEDDNVLIRLVHASLGMNTEQAEFADALKKYIFCGQKSVDRTNLIEELGDQLWYIGIALDALLSSFDEAMEININKLKARYGDKFSNEKAIERDLVSERDVLENSRMGDNL